MTVEISESFHSGVDPNEVSRFARSVLATEGVAPDAVLTIAFVDTDRMSELNASHMKKDGPTDVLSFPIEDGAPGRPPVSDPDGPPLELGDIFICTDIVAEHAASYGVSFEDELHLMVCHGVLHILGWDHQTEAETELMETREAEHLARIGTVRR